jgi:hypothetical protein
MRKYEDGGELTERMPEGGLPSGAKTFNEAFKNARTEGKKTFNWRGKDYSTAMAASSASSKTDTGDETARMKARAPAPAPTRATASQQMADRAAEQARSARAASEERASRAREAEAETKRESRGSEAPKPRSIYENLDLGTVGSAALGLASLHPAGRLASAGMRGVKGAADAVKASRAARAAKAAERVEPEFRKGGVVRGGVTRGDGCARKGHTKGRMV